MTDEKIDEKKVKIFVYGTLLVPEVKREVLGFSPSGKSAVLVGYRKEGLDIIESSNDEVVGEIIEVTEEDLLKLDEYEEVEKGFYRRIKVKIGSEEFFVYDKPSRDE